MSAVARQNVDIVPNHPNSSCFAPPAQSAPILRNIKWHLPTPANAVTEHAMHPIRELDAPVPSCMLMQLQIERVQGQK